MERLTEQQLAQVVAEVTRLSQEREEFRQKTLDRSQVLQVLKELSLPTELLDDALIQLERRELLKKEEERRKKMKMFFVAVALVIIAMIAAGAAITYSFVQKQREAIEAVTSDVGRISVQANSEDDLSSVKREVGEVRYRAKLQNAPIGRQLDLSCRWYGPSGKLEHENRWRTKPIDKSVWPTECRCRLGSGSPTGDWRVEMLLEGRVLSSKTFRVE
ncbi:MAG: DUF3859 domain-containing protein [Acidobacteriota bacterium]|nr:DUF3859 domain-containing protein [Blastocatellia bacterium]MDW8412749.1 DUF3859 domain-containing protein [Acidobacteriota bacterium]